MDLNVLQQQFRGRRFGELVMEHHTTIDLAMTLEAMQDTIAELPPVAQPLVESWLDEMNSGARSEAFWREDCGDALNRITRAGAAKLRGAGIDKPTADDLFNMFQIVVLNFAYAAHRHKQSKAFIQKALGIGFLRRLIS